MLDVLQTLRFEYAELPFAGEMHRELDEWLNGDARPRVGFVKQDVQDDLYCCSVGSSANEIVCSTLMRSGPVALFTRLTSEFLIVGTELDPECQAWMEKAMELGWYDRRKLEQYRDKVPGRELGQSGFAHSCDEIDWSEYDIVISLDISVPARITRKFPNTLWCYYIREPKTSSYSRSNLYPLPGQDVFLNQRFGIRRKPSEASHVLDFPYYLQYYGCFHDVLSLDATKMPDRFTIFLEHHTPEWMSGDQLAALEKIGPLDSTCLLSTGDRTFAHYNQKCERTPAEIYKSLVNSKYFIASPRVRNVWGNAAVEAISAGALVVGNPQHHTHNAFFSRRTSAMTFDELITALRYLESHPNVYQAELRRQRRIVDYLCYLRPLHSLLRMRIKHGSSVLMRGV